MFKNHTLLDRLKKQHPYQFECVSVGSIGLDPVRQCLLVKARHSSLEVNRGTWLGKEASASLHSSHSSSKEKMFLQIGI